MFTKIKNTLLRVRASFHQNLIPLKRVLVKFLTLEMMNQVLKIVWLLFLTFTLLHALPTTGQAEPITNEKIRLTEDSGSPVAIEEVANVGPAQVYNENNEGIVQKKFDECEDIAENKVNVSWLTKIKCLKFLWAAMKTGEKNIQVTTES